MTDDKKIIDFEAIREARNPDPEQAHWADTRNQLFEVMAASGLQDISITAATLNALLMRLEAAGMSRSDAKTLIARALKAFQA
jgi:hypothetical protein